MSRSITKQLLKSVAAPAVLALAALHAQAAPVSVAISNFSFTPGSGYGVDANEASGTLLDVHFSTAAFSAQNFVLNTVGSTNSFNVGTVELRERDAASGIETNETDNLGVTATFTFTSPFGSLIQVSATGTATTGSVSDSHADLVIDWAPMQMAFGTGGLLGIELSDLTFYGQGTLTQRATVTLIDGGVTRDVNPNQIPEPGSMALAGLALAGLGFVRRPRRG